jgi:hypothetical protein
MALCSYDETTLYLCASVRCRPIRIQTGEKLKLYSEYVHGHYYGYPLLLHTPNEHQIFNYTDQTC